MSNIIETAAKIIYEDLSKKENVVHNCHKSLVKLMNFMTGYDWKSGDIKNSNILKSNEVQSNQLQLLPIIYKRVVLLSGGLDSLAGVAYLINNNLINNTIFVTFDTKQSDSRNAKEVFKSLEKNFDSIKHVIYSSQINFDKKNDNQRTRTFWFLSCAMETAKIHNVEEVFLFENGVVSMNPQITPDRSLTKTTHPHTMHMMREYFKNNIKTPFHNLTKTQILEIILNNSFTKPFAKYTQTCSKGKQFVNTHMTQKKKNERLKNCGLCYGCIMRRIAEVNLMFCDTEYACDKKHTDKKLTKKMNMDLVSLKTYIKQLKVSIDSGEIGWFLYSCNKNLYLKMYEKLSKELENAREVWE